MSNRPIMHLPYSAAAADAHLQKLQDIRFRIVLRDTVSEGLANSDLADSYEAEETVRRITGLKDVEVFIHHTFIPPGLRPRSRLTVMVGDDGKAINAWFG